MRRPEGERVNIISMTDGKPFDLQRNYTCAMTAYRANGGGELLTKGAGIPKEELERRILLITTHDIRYYLMEYVREEKDISPEPMNHWKFIPESWIAKAKEREMAILFQAGDSEAEDEANDR